MLNRKTTIFLLSSLAVSAQLFARPDVVPAVHHDIHRQLIEQQVISSYFHTMVDSVENIQGAQPFELHPSLDLYTTWNDNFDPMNGRRPADLKDFYDIDLRGWYAPIKGRITSPFGWRKKRMHKGEDINLFTGDTVRAAFDGRVRIRRFEKRGYGNYYVIRHDNGLETIYGHLSKHIVKQDDYVKAGQAIGLGGSTGRSTGPHLHFEMRFMGIALDPARLINFDTFEPHDSIYHLDRKLAEAEQIYKSRDGRTRRQDYASSNGRRTTSNRVTPGRADRNNSRSNGSSAYHTIKKGDTLGAIARRYGTTVSRICSLNGIKANTKLQIGRKLRYK